MDTPHQKPDRQYLVRHCDGTISGPMNSAAIKSLATGGRVTPDDELSREGSDEWYPAWKAKNLFTEEKLAGYGNTGRQRAATDSKMAYGGYETLEGTPEPQYWYIFDGTVSGPVSMGVLAGRAVIPIPKEFRARSALVRERDARIHEMMSASGKEADNGCERTSAGGR